MPLPQPKIERSLTLTMRGDWGRANLHRGLGWLSYELGTLSGPHSKFGIWNGRGGRDNVRAVGRGEIDLSLATPDTFMPLAARGLAGGDGETYPHLRSLGFIQQYDCMVVAVRRELGFTTWEEFRARKPALRIAQGVDDGDSFIGLGARLAMEAHGFSRAALEQQGCTFLEIEEPRFLTAAVARGEADMIIEEAVMTPWWSDLADSVDLVYLPVEPSARDYLQSRYSIPTASLPEGYLRGMDREMEFMDFSHFTLLATTDLPDDVAYALAWCLIERSATFEEQYHHIPSSRSPVTYPIDPRVACRSAIPLHPGAERFYREAGYL